MAKQFSNSGGSAGIRSMADYQAQVEKVMARWRGWIFHRKVKTTYRLGVRVPRRQALDVSDE